MLRFAWLLRSTPSPRPLPLRWGEGARRAGEGATRITTSPDLLAYAVLSHALDAAHQRPQARPAQSLAVSAQSFYPAILEELLQVAVTGLNAVARNLRSDLPAWKEVFEKEGRPDMKRIAKLMIRVGDKFEKAEHYLFPPLIGYETTTQKKAKEEGPALNIFAFLLPGMAAMFLLFLADHAIRDLYREVTARTLDRFRTLHDRLLPFVISTVVLAMAVVVLGSRVMVGVVVLVFGIPWH